MSQQNPSPRRKSGIDRQRLKRKLSRAFNTVMSDVDNVAGVPLDIRFVTDSEGRKVRPTVLYEYETIDDDTQA